MRPCPVTHASALPWRQALHCATDFNVTECTQAPERSKEDFMVSRCQPTATKVFQISMRSLGACMCKHACMHACIC